MRQHTFKMSYLINEVHFYSTEINGELVLFDTGPATQESLAFLQKEIDLPRLKYLFITHCHVDHCGLSEFIATHTDAQIFLPRMDIVRLQRSAEVANAQKILLMECGFAEDSIGQMFEEFSRHKIFESVPGRYQSVESSDIPGKLGIFCLPCPGHCQSDMVYLVGKYAITGDILLRNIFQTPLLEVDLATFSGRFRNYDAYCNSLAVLQGLRWHQILPGHGLSVDSLDETIIFYVTTLLERVQQLKKHVLTDTIHDVIKKLFDNAISDPLVLFAKASEIIFMLDFLAEPARLINALREIELYDHVSSTLIVSVRQFT